MSPETNSPHPEPPTEGMKVLREIFDEMLTEDDVWDGMHQGQEALRKKAANMTDIESEIAVTDEEREKMLDSGATSEELDPINLKLLGLRALRQQIKHGEEYP